MRFLAALMVGLVWAGSAWATCGSGSGTCFWIGGAGTLDLAADSAHWSASSGGTTCSCEPQQTGTADGLTFDGSSGGGTVTWAAGPFTIGALTAGAFTGTLALNTNNPSVTTQTISFSGSGARTINCGTGTLTVNATSGTVFDNTTTTSETLTCSSGTVAIGSVTPTALRTVATGAKTWGTFTIASGGSTAFPVFITASGGTITALTLTAPVYVEFLHGATTTLTNAPNWNGSSGNVINLTSDSIGTAATVHLTNAATGCSWAALRDMTFNTSAITCNNSFDLQHNSGVTINAPVLGNSSGIIGG